jgi:hypothetical protein
MYNRYRVLSFAAAASISLALALAGCGDGSSSSDMGSTPASSTSTPAPSAATPAASTPVPGSTAAETTVVTISGVVATGAPCANAPVRLPGLTTSPANIRTAKDGSYSATVTIPASAAGKAQVLQADCDNDAGGSDTLVSIMASPASGTVNINPFTNLICVLISKSGDPKQCGAGLTNGIATVNANDIKAGVAQLKEILLPLITAAAINVFDPIAGTAIANGTGFDRLQDMVQISITPQENGISSIEIRLKVININQADSQPVIRFTNLSTTDAIKLANKIDAVSVQDVRIAGNLILPSGTSALIAELVGRINACYALPASERWNGITLLAPECAKIFVDGNISNYLKNGVSDLAAVLGPLTGTGFNDLPLSGLLRDPKDVQFSMGTYQYIRSNGLLGFSARKTTPGSTATSVTFNAQTGADGKLGLSGNQYRYEATLIPFAERRTFINQTESSYLSTGVNILVPLQARDGVPVTRVVLTPPPNKIANNPASFTLFPGADGMALPMQDALLNDTIATSASSFLRLRSEYVDKAANANSRPPSRRDFGQHFANDITESALLQLGIGDVWTLDFYIGGASAPDATQYYRLPARPSTIAALRGQPLPDLQASTRLFLKSLLNFVEPGAPSNTPLTGLPALKVQLTSAPDEFIEPRVIGLTAPPRSLVNIFFTDSLEFEDRFFAPITDQVTIPCRNGSIGDLHCLPDGRYASNAILLGVELLKSLPDRLMLAHHFSVLQLLP